jgi:hypothetical protein
MTMGGGLDSDPLSSMGHVSIGMEGNCWVEACLNPTQNHDN